MPPILMSISPAHEVRESSSRPSSVLCQFPKELCESYLHKERQIKICLNSEASAHAAARLRTQRPTALARSAAKQRTCQLREKTKCAPKGDRPARSVRRLPRSRRLSSASHTGGEIMGDDDSDSKMTEDGRCAAERLASRRTDTHHWLLARCPS